MNARAQELVRITASMTVACAIGALILGAVYAGTERYARAARAAGERKAITELLSLDAGAEVREVRQYLDPARQRVVYRVPGAGGPERELVFTLDGTLERSGEAAAAGESAPEGLKPLGRLFVASRAGRPAGFVVEGESRGYKNIIRFFVALDSSFQVAGVRVVEHEEDPGLGAETATPWFQGQYVGRAADSISTLDVTRDPMPEDWRAALGTLARTPVPAWRERHGALMAREAQRPIYAVTGATISSRALTVGVRTTVEHFRRRWSLLAPHLGGPA